MMPSIRLQPTATAHWHELVHEAARNCGSSLEEDLESYLVFLLMRFVQRPDMAGSVLALQYLRGLLRRGRDQRQQLQEVGDQCLLVSGLFPLRARRRAVRVRYYVDLGRSAYQQLASVGEAAWSETFGRLSRSFVTLMDILQAMREFDANDPLDALALDELAEECDSRRARQRLDQQFPGARVQRGNRRRH